jgi:squalene/oxidosqualene cyclase-like protein
MESAVRAKTRKREQSGAHKTPTQVEARGSAREQNHARGVHEATLSSPGSEGTASRTIDNAIDKALAYLASKQADTGAWLGDYGGPMFLLPMYIGTCYATGAPLAADVRADMIRYLRNTQNADGGFGLHVESHSYMFTSCTTYAALRLADVPADDPMVIRARKFIRDNGGPLAAASWGKFFLTLLNLHDYRGLNPVQPELWLLPRALPFHPSRLWVHARMVYLPMSYLYGHRVQLPLDAKIAEIRSELYDMPYERIDWEAARDRVAPSDDYTPISPLLKKINRVLDLYERAPIQALRRKALSFVLDQVEAEDRNTNYVCVGPVNKLYHLWVWHHARKGGPEFQKHVERLPEYLWQAEDGTKMQGYHSSQLWDTAFAVQATYAAGAEQRYASMLARAHDFIDQNQVREDLPLRERSFRDPTKGGFCFSAKDNGWIVSDCTAEGLRAALLLRDHVQTPLSKERLRDSVNYLLFAQTKGGGWASYEPSRGPAWLEQLNPSNVFGHIMIDYPYVECTAAALLGLRRFQETFPGECDAEIESAIQRGKQYLLAEQREDGSFEGSWGICFTYGTWFGIEGLKAAGLPLSAEPIQRALDFLVGKQLPDGGWGETAASCSTRNYVHAESGQAVMTSWALLGLIQGGRANSEAVREGVAFLITRQREDGSFPSEHIAGMFNKTCAITYDNYLKVFPLWALGEARRHLS